MPFLDMNHITKRFPGVTACDDISFEVARGEIHCLLGENGAGKTTLMNILYGLYQPDTGEIFFRGHPLAINSPRDAIDAGIGMVHQHFMLVRPFSVMENIILGLQTGRGPVLDFKAACQTVRQLSNTYGLAVEPEAKIWQLPVGIQQRVEILKALYRNAELLILDEPTAVLTPSEIEELFAVLKRLRNDGHSIVFITHKLDEVMAISDRVTVLRDGKVVDTVTTQSSTKANLARMMIGRDVIWQVKRDTTLCGEPALELEDVWALSDRGVWALCGISLTVHQGEIFGLAGVDGNGQTELAEVIIGLRPPERGCIKVRDKDVTHLSPRAILEHQVSHIPEDRHEAGLVLSFSLANNLILDTCYQAPFTKYGILRQKVIDENAQRLIQEFDIRAPDAQIPVSLLSGGNQQKAIVARTLSRRPEVIIAAQPTRGLDVGATEFVRSRLLTYRKQGAAVLYISTDLQEIMMLSDRVGVIHRGRIVGTLDAGSIDLERLGLLMAGVRSEDDQEAKLDGSQASVE